MEGWSLEPLEGKPGRKAHAEGRAAEEALGSGRVSAGRIDVEASSADEEMKSFQRISEAEQKLASVQARLLAGDESLRQQVTMARLTLEEDRKRHDDRFKKTLH